jgi:hypothetical protein
MVSVHSDWKTYENKTLGITFKYPKSWQASEDIEAEVNQENKNCSVQNGNAFTIDIAEPVNGGISIEGGSRECIGGGQFGFFLEAKKFEEVQNNEKVSFNNIDYYLDFEQVNPGVHAFHAYPNKQVKNTDSVHIYYSPSSDILVNTKEYTGNEEEYKKAKQMFLDFLSTLKF